MAEPAKPTDNNQSSPSPSPRPPVSGPLASLETTFYEWFVYKAPFQLPVGLTDFIVKVGPWITLVLGILLLPALFAVFTIGSSVGTYGTANASYVYQPGPLYWLGLLVLLVQVAIMFVSIPMLLKRKRNGWLLLFYADLISIAYGLLNSFAYGYFSITNLILTLISAAIGLYVLFQIRHYYTA